MMMIRAHAKFAPLDFTDKTSLGNAAVFFFIQTEHPFYRVEGPLWKKDFFSPLRFEAKNDFDHQTSKLKPHSIRASGQYLNHRNLIHGRETTSILDIVERNFESDVS